MGGASAGSLLAACLKSGMPLDSVVEANLRLMADLRAGGTRGRLGVRRERQTPGGSRQCGMHRALQPATMPIDLLLLAATAALAAPQAVVRQFLEERLPEDAHERCRDRAFVSCCCLSP